MTWVIAFLLISTLITVGITAKICGLNSRMAAAERREQLRERGLLP